MNRLQTKSTKKTLLTLISAISLKCQTFVNKTKLVLTEAQIRFITEAEQINILKNSLNESVNFNDLVKTIKKALAVGVTATAIIASINSLNINDEAKQELTDIVTEEPVYR